MAVTYADIVSRVKQQLLGYTKDQASVSYLTADISDTDMSFSVDPGTVNNLSRGLIEVDDEMMLVKTYDRNLGILTLFGLPSTPSTGRGVEGTTAAPHSAGALVTDDPRFPRERIKEAINDTINGVYPDLWVFGQYEFPYVAARYEYPVPVDVDDVYKVTSNTIGPSAIWYPMTNWRFNPMASTTAGQVKPTPTPTGKTIMVDLGNNRTVPGRNIRVSYTKAPNILVNNDDDFTTTTGFPERYIDMIVYGACWRVLPSYEAGRLQQQAIEATERAELVPTSAASNATQFFLALYTKRLTEERTRLQRLFESYQTMNS